MTISLHAETELLSFLPAVRSNVLSLSDLCLVLLLLESRSPVVVVFVCLSVCAVTLSLLITLKNNECGPNWLEMFYLWEGANF